MTDPDPIVITGMGAVSPLGIGVEANWRALMEGKSGIVMNDRFDVTAYERPDMDKPARRAEAAPVV